MSHELLLSELEGRTEKIIANFNKIIEASKLIDLKEPYTAQTAPDWVQKLPKEARDGWIKAYNAAFKQYDKDEGKAAAVANSALGKMGYKKNKEGKWVKVKEAGQMSAEDVAKQKDTNKIFNELLADIGAFLSKAETGIKGKVGSPAIRQFLREVKSKLKNMVKDIKETDLKEKAQTIVDKIAQMEEGALKGSFEDLRNKLEGALESTSLFPTVPGYDGRPYIRYTFSDRMLVSYASKNYEVTYTIKDGNFAFGAPKEVEETYVVKESKESLETKEARGQGQGVGGARQGDGGADICKCPKCGNTQPHTKGIPCNKIKCSKCGTLMVGANSSTSKEADIKPNMEISDYISLQEAKFDEAKKEVEVILIEAGTNEQKRRHYPKHTVEEAAPLFKGLKNYINHPTKKEEVERPERNLRDWASTITESRGENGKAIGKIAVHDQWLWDMLQDPVARGHMGLSIVAKGKSYIGKINNQDMQIVEKIVQPSSVDWVTEAGARGRVVQLIESRKEDQNMLDTITLQELKDTRPDLVKEITKEVGKDADPKLIETKVKEAIEKENKGLRDQLKLRDQKDLVESWLKESKLPDAAKKKVKDKFSEKVFDGDETKLKESFDNAVKNEFDYIANFDQSGKIKDLGEGKETSIKESVGKSLDKRAGIKEEKKEENK